MSDVEQQAQLRRSIASMADRVARRAGAEAVRETLTALGIDVDDKLKAQAQFAALRKLTEARTLDNLEWVDSLRTSSDRVREVSWRTIIKIIVTGIAGFIVMMTKEYWSNHIPWK